MTNRAERRRLEKEAKKAAKLRGGVDSPEATERSHLIYNEALALQKQGKLTQAITRYKDAIKLNTKFAEANTNLGNLYEEQGKWQDAEAAYRRALQVYPDNVMLLSNLGNVLRRLDRLDEATEFLQQALMLQPNSIQALNNLGNVLLAQEKPVEAVACFTRAVEANPGLLESQINFGAALEAAGNYAEALSVLEQARKLHPDSALIYFNLGHVLNNLGKSDEAIAMYEQALTLKPDYVQAAVNLASLQRKHGKNDAAAQIYRRLLADNPKLVEAYLELAVVQQRLGDSEGAVKILKNATTIIPNNATIYNSLANTLHDAGKSQDAITAFHKALKIKPDFALAYIGLGVVFSAMYQYDNAIEAYRKALAIEPDNGAAYMNLAGTLHDQGHLDEAIQVYREALDQQKIKDIALHAIHSNYLLILNYSARITQQELYNAHLGYARRYETSFLNTQIVHTHEQHTKRKIRIGYVSADFREHSVVYFIEPLLTHYDHDCFEVYCYADVAKPDAYTRRLQDSVDYWRELAGQSDEDVAKLIRADGIDVLVDLAGHTNAGARLLVFARKPAPVQVTYLGYPNTTGLASMNYRITDAWADPPGQEKFHSEQLIRLQQGFLCHRLPQTLLSINETPAMKNGYITFGSFNNLAKTVPEVVALWSRILLQLPASKLLLKNKSFRDKAVCENYRSQFVQHGVDPDRLELIGWLENKDDHLGLYQRVDICLDTFPYNGTTTTCEAMSMGVPVITLCGQRHASRVGNSLLHQVGLTELITATEADYLRTACELARDTSRLQSLRTSIRERMRTSALCDETAFCQQVEAAYLQMWEAWCNQK